MADDEDQIKREKIPARASLNTSYSPMGNLVMVVPLPDVDKVGMIHLPNRSSLQMTEGHVVEKGPNVSENIEVGDCVMWDESAEFRYDVDGTKFVLIKEVCISMRIPKAKLLISAEQRSKK